ncbi:MAG: hypothetical protein COV35_03550 [Alphaproteobacteria bacterium CG11_big_fil_rev_8_21_14_0_20_39_49]|nr:MAG: hypothetical protein COV35_03550 [Alphaproteobacteria bacterium CG11_big_fil_rev_8_21_14_0_20_39_49]
MTVDCLWELQKAVYTALDNDATISAIVNGVYSHVVQGTSYPYIKINISEAVDWSTKTTIGIKARLSLETYSKERGNKETNDILTQIKQVLDGATLAMTGCTMISGRYVFSNSELMADGLTWKGNIAFDFLVQED